MKTPFLISKEILSNFKEQGFDIKKNPRTGQSTAIALETIAEAIRNPNKPIKIIDHFDTKPSHRFLLDRTAKIIQTLDLQGFLFNTAKNTITFYLYEE